MCIYIYIYSCMYILYIYAHTHAHTYIHTHTHTYCWSLIFKCDQGVQQITHPFYFSLNFLISQKFPHLTERSKISLISKSGEGDKHITNPFPSSIFWHGAQVTIGEVQGQGVRIASRCLWDVETGSFDCKIALEYKTHCTTWRSMRSRASYVTLRIASRCLWDVETDSF